MTPADLKRTKQLINNLLNEIENKSISITDAKNKAKLISEVMHAIEKNNKEQLSQLTTKLDKLLGN
jgi:hypothetical protein